MKVIIAGTRNFSNYEMLKHDLDLYRSTTSVTEIVSGGCRGADLLGEKYAKENNIPIKRFPANWEVYGKKAGPIRNEEMAEYVDCLIAYWDSKSRGTKNMIETMRKKHKPYLVYLVGEGEIVF